MVINLKNNCKTQITVHFNIKLLFYIPKRKMHTLTHLRNLMYRGNIHKNATPIVENSKTQFTRNHTNWTGRVRLEDCKYDNNPSQMEVDPETKLEIMRAYDASGKNHVLLIDENYKHDRFYLVRGSFTSSSTFYNNIPPDMVAGFTLEGGAKPQFLHRYEKPRLIEKVHVVVHTEATTCLKESPEYIEYLHNLPHRHT